MCYDIKASLEAQLHKARRDNDLQAIEEILEKLIPLTDLPLYHSSGFHHPDLLIYTAQSPDFPIVATWGLIPHWVSDVQQKKEIWNKTLNARGETIFEKPSFKTAATAQRAILYIDGFYEHHHFNKATYPYYIQALDMQPLALAALYDKWMDPQTHGIIRSFTIVTTKAVAIMEKIHNNPKLKEARMPMLLSQEEEQLWLSSSQTAQIQELLRRPPNIALKAYTVGKLRGKSYQGNVASISDQVHYPELELKDSSLFE